MQLSSSAFTDGGTIPRRFTCDGEDLSPPFQWSEPPSGTRSFVLLCDDPDAPSGTFRHWALYDIPADRAELVQGFDRSCEKEGLKRAINDFNRLGYQGPCPPHRHGPHHYHFRLLALSQRAILPRGCKRGAQICARRGRYCRNLREMNISKSRSESLAISSVNSVTGVSP